MPLPASLDDDGWLTDVNRVVSPNCDARPPGVAIDLAVIHSISLPPGQFGGDAIERLFTNRLDSAAHPYYATISDLKVSAHFLVRRGGGLTQFVPCRQRAWHAGASSWRGRSRCNDFSVGIELEGSDEQSFEAAQYEVLAKVIAELRRHYPIIDIAGHADIAPGRKTDPGPKFDWARLNRLLIGNKC